MAPSIRVESVSKAFTTPLFEGVTFAVEPNEKVALVGPNGAGKTTLLRILAGRETAQGGVHVSGRIHWFDQHPEIPNGASVTDLLSSKPAPPELLARYEVLEARIGDPALYEQPGYEAVLEEYAALEREIKMATAPAKGDNPLIEALGIDLTQDAKSLSGGEKTRIFLARTLQDAKPGDIVILDEPTNHLDVDAIEWLEDWINGFEGIILMVAHDRAFLDNVATRILEVRNQVVTSFVGNYEDYVQARDENDERLRREHARAGDRVADAKAIIMQFRKQKRFDGQYASRMRALEKYQAALQRNPDPVMESLGFGLAFGAVEKSSNETFRLNGIDKTYAEPVLQGLDFEVAKGERVGLVGANGAGKSTLLRILTGRETKDAGTIHVAPGVKGAFFSQEHDDLDANRTLLQEVRDARPTLEERDVKALLGRFRFKPEVDMPRKVSTLSGGERQRLMLLKCVLKPSNLLILDEPTNHLDLWARDVVANALNSYKGTIIVVSHDRFLLDSVTDTTAVLDGGKLFHYTGSFTETRDMHRVKNDVAQVVYLVEKKFTDWTTNRKFRREEEVTLSPAEIANSMTLRNALAQGWLVQL